MKPTVLIAEADEKLAEAVSSYLVAHDCDVCIARSGLECLEEVRRFRPQVLVLAVELLWGGGCGVLACLRELRFGCCPAVVLTATPINEHRLTRFAPVVDCLLKPFPVTSLLESIERALNLSGNVIYQESLR
jgi:DNA-binding response OmpR family regulator